MRKKSVLLTKQRERMLAELERNGVKSIKHNGFEDAVLEKLMHSLKENEDSNDMQLSKNTNDYYYDDDVLRQYSSTLADYIYKMTSASVLFLMCFPWTALWWPPYYYYYRRYSANK